MRRGRLLDGTRVLIACVATLAPAILLAPPASAACAADPDAPTIRQMIVTGTTGSDWYDVLILGRVFRLRDLGGGEGGPTMARFRVREHPVGSAPDRAGVRFWKAPDGVGLSENFEFREGHRYAVLAHRRSGGEFVFDGACGQTTSLTRAKMWRLIRLYRHG